MIISEGFKVSDFGGGPGHKPSKLYPSSRYHGNVPRGTLQVAHGVIRFCSDDVFCPKKTPQNTKAI